MANVPQHAPASSRFQMTGYDYLLYAGLLWGWSTSWYAIRLQLGEVAPEVSVFWRFLLTAPLMALLSRGRGESLAIPLNQHGWLALTGILMFSTNFILFYTAGLYLTSGLLAVIFSLASILNLTFGALFAGERFHSRMVIGALVGVCGVALMFHPELIRLEADARTAIGAGLAVAGTLCFTSGNQVSALLQRRGHRVLPTASWGMAYGAFWSAGLSLVGGRAFVLPLTPTYLGSLAFLILSATILAFFTYLTLIGRIGAARASYATVIFPVIALLISTLLEGYRWSLPAVAGLVLALAGNLLVLKREG